LIGCRLQLCNWVKKKKTAVCPKHQGNKTEKSQAVLRMCEAVHHLLMALNRNRFGENEPLRVKHRPATRRFRDVYLLIANGALQVKQVACSED